MTIKIPDIIKSIAQVLKDNGNKCFIVGGSVRDSVLGEEPKDFDIATDLFVDQVIELFKDKDFVLDIKKTGDKFPVARIFTTCENEFEIATFRTDVGKGKDTDFVIVSDIESDVNRRDFTFNALFADALTGEIIDIVGGKKDLSDKIIRFVGDPIKRIEEDRTRLLRLVRFKERFGFSIADIEQIKLCSILIEGLEPKDQVKKEMIVSEILKGFDQAKDKLSFFDTLMKLNLLQQAFPGCEIDFPKIESQHFSIMLFQILMKNDREQVLSVMRDMTWSNDDIDKIKCLFLLRDQDFSTQGSLSKLVRLIDDSKSRKMIFDLSKIIGDSVLKFSSFKLSVRATDFPEFKGIELGKKIHNKELELLNERN